MPLLPLSLPPGFFHPGTVYDARGRWFDGNLVRWYGKSLRPIGGWFVMDASITGVPVDVGDPVRGMWAFKDLTRAPVLGFGTFDSLWVFRSGELLDITPNDLVVGAASANIVSGQYGQGPYGIGAYGFGVEEGGVLVEATSWQIDNYGGFLLACSIADGRIFIKDDPSTSTEAVPLPNAPTDCVGVVVTPERFVLALGANGDDRLLAWSDQENAEEWTPDVDNQAGDFPLTTPGNIMAGRRGSNETLIWTDTDIWRMRYIGGVLVYQVTRIAENCGATSRQAMATESGRAFWMGSRQFFMYDGSVRPIDCDVAEVVFEDLNRLQRSKITSFTRAQFDEVTWHYPSAGSNENNRYVTLNYTTGRWTFGALERTAGVDIGAFGFPIAADASGRVYQHEVVNEDHDDPEGNPIPVFAETGPFEIGTGDNVMYLSQLIPDIDSFGSVRATLFTSFYPITAETEHGPYDLDGQPIDFRVTGRQFRLRLEGINNDWRSGTFRVDAMPGGRR